MNELSLWDILGVIFIGWLIGMFLLSIFLRR